MSFLMVIIPIIRFVVIGGMSGGEGTTQREIAMFAYTQ